MELPTVKITFVEDDLLGYTVHKRQLCCEVLFLMQGFFLMTLVMSKEGKAVERV
jgi:hypothetical protein